MNDKKETIEAQGQRLKTCRHRLNSSDPFKPCPVCHGVSMPITSLGLGVLYRAFVSIPEYLLVDRDRLLDERVVFFEVSGAVNPGQKLVQLLSLVWCIDSSNWLESGLIYNIYSAKELMSINSSVELEWRLLEMGSGPGGIHYAMREDVDLLVTPRVAKRLNDLIDQAKC
ncbi:MAG: hypothetical protein PHY54_18570 [Methylococcales bacterium]|nr:hypothetical protein [Methylococcales bacterium]